MKNNKIIFLGFLHALGQAIYVSLVVLFIQNGEKIFGKANNFFGPLALLTLFVLSAAISGALVFGRPILFYLENKKAEAIKLFFSTLGWLFIFFLIILFYQILK